MASTASPARYLNAVRWDSESRSWVPCAPVYYDRPTNSDGSPRPCPECGTTRPCTHDPALWGEDV